MNDPLFCVIRGATVITAVIVLCFMTIYSLSYLLGTQPKDTAEVVCGAFLAVFICFIVGAVLTTPDNTKQ